MVTFSRMWKQGLSHMELPWVNPQTNQPVVHASGLGFQGKADVVTLHLAVPSSGGLHRNHDPPCSPPPCVRQAQLIWVTPLFSIPDNPSSVWMAFLIFPLHVSVPHWLPLFSDFRTAPCSLNGVSRARYSCLEQTSTPMDWCLHTGNPFHNFPLRGQHGPRSFAVTH